jgi:DNA-binding IclR family transcriptional regulator
MTQTDEQMAYSAPALEKGLDVLELLAKDGRPRTMAAIAEQLGRSKSEIFRMIFVLLHRGYLERLPDTDEIYLTDRLLSLALQTQRVRDLVSEALPALRKLSEETQCSAHLVVVHQGETMVVASASGIADMNFTLKLGYRRPALDATSGQVILAFQDGQRQQKLIEEAAAKMTAPVNAAKAAADLERIRAQGYELHRSRDFMGLLDVCCPILDAEGHAVAAVILSYLKRRGRPNSLMPSLSALQSTCAAVAARMS